MEHGIFIFFLSAFIQHAHNLFGFWSCLRQYDQSRNFRIIQIMKCSLYLHNATYI